ncbi:MAG: hypothetical protein U0271_10995 [Polyangiaceae bacterium]
MGEEVLQFDGVAMTTRGDVLLIVYKSPAKLHRTRWLFDRIDEFLASRSAPAMGFMLILPTADPPDAPTREENSVRMRKIGDKLRRLVTTPVGDDLRVMLVRTVMRGLAILHGRTRDHFVTSTVAEGLSRVAEAAGPETPPQAQLVLDLGRLQRALGTTPVSAGASYPP